MDYPGVVQIEFPGRGIDAIAFLRDGERHNSDLRLAKFLNNGGQRVQLCVQAFMDGTDDNRLIASPSKVVIPICVTAMTTTIHVCRQGSIYRLTLIDQTHRTGIFTAHQFYLLSYNFTLALLING